MIPLHIGVYPWSIGKVIVAVPSSWPIFGSRHCSVTSPRKDWLGVWIIRRRCWLCWHVLLWCKNALPETMSWTEMRMYALLLGISEDYCGPSKNNRFSSLAWDVRLTTCFVRCRAGVGIWRIAAPLLLREPLGAGWRWSAGEGLHSAAMMRLRTRD